MVMHGEDEPHAALYLAAARVAISCYEGLKGGTTSLALNTWGKETHGKDLEIERLSWNEFEEQEKRQGVSGF